VGAGAGPVTAGRGSGATSGWLRGTVLGRAGLQHPSNTGNIMLTVVGEIYNSIQMSYSACKTSCSWNYVEPIMIRKLDDDDHIDEVRLCLWTAATNGPTVHPPGDTWAWRTMMKWCWQRKIDLSIRAIWQSYQQSHLEASRRNGQREWWIWPCKVFLFVLASDF
jgi:hypothetical protein